jgi:hypothetical protein
LSTHLAALHILDVVHDDETTVLVNLHFPLQC